MKVSLANTGSRIGIWSAAAEDPGFKSLFRTTGLVTEVLGYDWQGTLKDNTERAQY